LRFVSPPVAKQQFSVKTEPAGMRVANSQKVFVTTIDHQKYSSQLLPTRFPSRERVFLKIVGEVERFAI
jgi:hypothetical protein